MINRIKSKQRRSFFDYCIRKKYLTNKKEIDLLFKKIIKCNIPCFVDSEWRGFILCYKRHLFLVVDNMKMAHDLLRVFFWNYKDYCKITVNYSVEFHKLLMKYRFRLINRNGAINTYEYIPRENKK